MNLFYYHLDGYLETMDSEQFIHIHGDSNETENFVFVRTQSGEKWFFNEHNARVNLKERLENLRYLQSLRMKMELNKSIRNVYPIADVSQLIGQLGVNSREYVL